MKIIFVDDEAVIGGAETLIYRISKRMMDRKMDVEVYCRRASIEIKELYTKDSIHLIEYKENFKPKFLGMTPGDIIITIHLWQYLELLNYIAVHKISAYLFFYVVHPNALKSSKKWKKIFRYFINQPIKNGNIVFMDEETLEKTANFYNINLSGNKRLIKRLPISEKEEQNNLIFSKRKFDFTILTVARAEYPFKGYIKELLQLFEKICNEANKSVKMVVISSGKEIDTLMSWISENKYKDRIELILNVDYEKLGEYYRLASLYVGMGTTVLEACSYSVPSIVVESYTYKCRSKGLFCNDPTHLSTNENEGESPLNLMKKIINLPIEDYITLSNKSRQAIKDNYNMDDFIDYVLNTKPQIYNVSRKLSILLLLKKIKRLFKLQYDSGG